MKRLTLAFSFVIIIATSIFTSRASAANYSVFAGVGESWAFSTIRLGINEWEFGKMSASTIGVVKRFKSGSVYGTFGPTIYVPNTGVGLMAGLGWEPYLFWGLRLRAEVMGFGVHTGSTKAEAVVGLSFSF